MSTNSTRNDITWIEKDSAHFIHAWVTIPTLRKAGVEGRFWADLLGTYCQKPIPDNVLIPLVAKRGGRGDDFAVYIGLPPKELLREELGGPFYRQLNTIGGTIEHGFKVHESLARYFFPRLSDFIYRS
jgi:hypothetical protein